MKFGLAWNTGAFGVDPDHMQVVAQYAEKLGFESFYVSEHIALYPGARVGSFEFPPATPVTDPLETLSFVAASTSRLLLGTAVLLIPYHHPVILAKRIATLDVQSKGRLRLLTVGLGSLPGEAAALGVDYATRGRRADEAIDVLRLLWREGEDGARHHGEFFRFDNVCVYPKPIQDVVPIHVGGSSDAAARRAGTRGDGFFPGGRLSLQQRREQLDLMRSAAQAQGRDANALEYTRFGSIDMDEGAVAARAAQGVTRIVVSPASLDLNEQKEQLSEFAIRHRLIPPAAETAETQIARTDRT